MKEVMTMANKKTVVQMYEELLAIEGLTQEQKDFLTKRIEITKKKNASGKGGELTPKQKEKLAQTNAHKDSVVAVMAEGVQYSPSDLVKLLDNAEIPNTQKLTPMLTALVEENRLVKTTVKGRNVYSLPVAEVGETED